MREEMKILSGLDMSGGVLDALEKACIRLVRSSWILSQPEGYRIERRQKLEERERQGEFPTPLLQPAEAVALVCRADRSAGVVSHGWLSPGDVRRREGKPRTQPGGAPRV